jgi:hypothetical protein
MEHDLVVHGAAKEWMRMRHHRRVAGIRRAKI